MLEAENAKGRVRPKGSQAPLCLLGIRCPLPERPLRRFGCSLRWEATKYPPLRRHDARQPRGWRPEGCGHPSTTVPPSSLC